MEAWEFAQKQALPYKAKIAHAKVKAREFYEHLNGQVFVSVGGLDSITLAIFLRKYVSKDIPAVSVSSLEDKSVQAIHQLLRGMVFLKPSKSKVEVLREFGYPVISKSIADRIDLLQHPTEHNATVRHAILTGETGAQGGYRWSKFMKLPAKWQVLFAQQEAPFKVSAKCCYYLKEKPCDAYAKETDRHVYMALMASEGGRRAHALVQHGCNYYGKTVTRSCPFAIFSKTDLLRLAIDLNVPVPEIYGRIVRLPDGSLSTTGAKRTGCTMCGFGVHLEKRPHRFDRLREANPQEWRFWMYDMGWGKVLDYIGVGWETQVPQQGRLIPIGELA